MYKVYPETIYNYELLNSTVNAATKSNLIFHRGAIEGGSFHATNLITGSYPFALSGDFVINFDFKYYSGLQRDWNHIFSFGTHNNYGGDNPYMPIAIDASRNNIASFYVISSSLVSSWHNYKVIKEGSKIKFLLDDVLKKEQTLTLSNINNLYFGGAGGAGVLNYYIKNIVINMGVPYLERKNKLFISNNRVYAIKP